MTAARPGGSGLQLRLRRVRRRLDPPQRNANGVWSERESLELALAGDDGSGGWGEAAPLPHYSPDDLELAEATLRSLPAATLASLAELAEPWALLDAVSRSLPEQAPSARFALETALLDRAARRAGAPLWRLLATAVDEAASEPRATRRGEPVALSALLPSSDPSAALALARRYRDQGVSTFKLKVGPERLQPQQAVTFERLRAELGDTIHLRADANGSLSRSGLERSLERLSACSVEFIEEPLAGAEPERLADSPCPIALDESLQHMPEASLERWLRLPPLRVLVLKPTTLGGFGACIALARVARASGRDALVSHAFEGPIGWAACAHLALALGGSRAAGLQPLAHQVAVWPRVEGGKLLAGAEPGLGGSR